MIARAWGRLLRISLAPSAAADVAAGAVLGGLGAWPGGSAPWLGIAASLCVYHGGLALNDWADRAGDARTRPDRPIPSGAIRPGAALAAGLGLPALGVLLAASARPVAGAWLLGVALLAIAYDLFGRGPLLGPLLLGLCRAGNLALGMVITCQAGTSSGEPCAGLALAWPAVLYGAYVFSVSRLGRLEDDEDPRPLGRRPARSLVAAAACLVALPAAGLAAVAMQRLPDWRPGIEATEAGRPYDVPVVAGLLAVAGTLGLLRLALTRGEWTRARVGAATGAALRRLLVFTAAASLLVVRSDAGGDLSLRAPFLVAALILSGYPLSYLLRRAFPPS